MELTEISVPDIAKRLASCKESSRNRAVRLLCSWLPNQNYSRFAAGVSDPELIKIWKGLFFCVWHSDKLPTQVELINRLSTLLSSLDPPLAGLYLDAFLITIRREWSGIDFLRLDKFYLLIRRFIHHVFVFLKNNSWNLGLTAGIVGILSQGSLLSVDKFPAAGVNYHIAEIFLDEIEEFLPLDKETLDLMLNPFISVMQTTTDKVLVNKIKVNIFDRLSVNGSNLLNDAETGRAVEKFGKIALVMGFSKRFFDLASSTETQQGNRKVLFGLHDRYLKLDRELEKSGLDISLKQHDSWSSVNENACDIKTIMPFTTDNCSDINEESDNGPIQKKKVKKAKKTLDGTGTNSKTKKKKKKSIDSSTENNGIDPAKKLKSKKQKQKLADSFAVGDSAEASIAIADNENGNCGSFDSNDMIGFDDTLLSNLQKQFEKVAAEAGMSGVSSPKVLKKRKRAKSTGNMKSFVNSQNFNGGSEAGKSAEMNVKKVRFSMNNNLIWKPQSPLPPQSLRLPPSLIPRGSALKKGLSPGPIRESPPTVKKIKVKGSSVKKGRKTLRTVTPAVKRFRLLQGVSS